MADFESWKALKQEQKDRWNIGAPYGRSGVWYYVEEGGEFPSAEKIAKDRHSRGVMKKMENKVTEFKIQRPTAAHKKVAAKKKGKK